MALGGFGLGAAALPAGAALAAKRGFSHGVASGEPSASSVLLWTRYVAAQETRLTAELAEDADFSQGRISGNVTADPERDFTAKITVQGLTAGRWYFYRFIAPDGTMSPVGRTRTLPEGPVSRFSLGVFSCSNIGFGYFNAYAHACARQDLDMVVHLGDYLYEYQAGNYPSVEQALAGRMLDPAHEILNLADYRLRYAAYRSDPDLQRLHQLYPAVMMWDDHETANDAWTGGAENHQPGEGSWDARKAVAERVYREWMPVRDRGGEEDYPTAYQIGNLATLMLTESRISGRDQPVSLSAALAGQEDVTAAISRFRDTVWLDPARSMLGASQERWLADTLRRSVKAGTRWQIWGQQSVMGQLKLPADSNQILADDAPEIAKQRVRIGTMAAKLGLPMNFDSWDGYPRARERGLAAAQAADANLIVLSGDSHNGWANDLSAGGKRAGVEFAGHSVTSPGFEAYVGRVPPQQLAAALVAANPDLKWADTAHRGYMTVSLSETRAESTWHFLNTVRQKSMNLAGEHRMSVNYGQRTLTSEM